MTNGDIKLVEAKKVIYFDSECLLCSKAALFIIRHDLDRKLWFASMKEGPDTGSDFMGSIGPGVRHKETIIYDDRGKIYVRSEAILRILHDIGWPWRVLFILRIIPLSWRDGAYDWVARNRQRWFGRKGYCFIPDDSVRERFL
jgi:predicted DCC family thiol-disulfide oxidoreductase YuxK